MQEFSHTVLNFRFWISVTHRHEVASRTPNSLPKARVDALVAKIEKLFSRLVFWFIGAMMDVGFVCCSLVWLVEWSAYIKCRGSYGKRLANRVCVQCEL